MRKVINLSESPDAGTILFQFLISSAIVLGCVFATTLLSIIILAVTGVPLGQLGANDWNTASPKLVYGMEIAQILSQVGIFIIPALLLPRIFFKVNPFRYTGLHRHSPFLMFGLAFLILYTVTPLLDLTTLFNAKLKLPHSFDWLQHWIESQEATNQAITRRFLAMPNVGTFLFNVFLMAVLPAFAEEIFFRGFVQRTMYVWWRNKHMAVILSAAFFSFIHFEFFGFIPRLLLGMLLGYLFLWSGNIKISMFVHFLNNFTIVLTSYIYQLQGKNFDTDTVYDFNGGYYILSILAGGLLLYAFYLNARKRRQQEEDGSVALLTSDEPWAKIYATPDSYQAEIIAGNLRSEGLQAVVINKRDSAYGLFGEAEVYVPQGDAQHARELLPSQ